MHNGEARISRRRFVKAVGAGGAMLFLPASAAARQLPSSALGDSVVVQWNTAFLQGVRNSKLGPPMVARALAIAHTCIYDAWAAYDDDAVGTRLGSALRQPPREHRVANIRQAVSFAAYRAAVDLFPASVASVFDPLMHTLGYDGADRSSDPSTPVGVGNVAAGAVLEFRHRDGANQLGDERGGIAGAAYSDYTGYAAVNRPMDLRVPFDPSTVVDPSRWQPLRYADGTGGTVTQQFVGAHWQHVTGFGLGPGGGLRSPTGPAEYGSRSYLTQAQALLQLSAGLTDEQKMVAEYWADGPHSELPPGHWNLFCQFVCRRDGHGDDLRGTERDAKLFFALTNALLDAACCAWDNKRAFDSVRPVTAIRALFNGTAVGAWGGPFHGTEPIDGGAWSPYQLRTAPTPPFPEYASGHSTFSAAGAEILRRFTGSDRFNGSVKLPAGSSKTEPGAVPARDVTLRWPTFSDAAAEAGMSRRYGGIHFQQGDLDGRAMGRIAGGLAWDKARRYWCGASAPSPDGDR
jgi:hypothetical protein